MRMAGRAPVRAPSRTNVRFAVTNAVQSVNKKTKCKKTTRQPTRRPKAPATPARPQGVSRRRLPADATNQNTPNNERTIEITATRACRFNYVNAMPLPAPERAQPAQTAGLTHANEPATQTAATTRKAAHAPVRAPSRTNVRFAVT